MITKSVTETTMKPSILALIIALAVILSATIWWAVSTLAVGGTWDMPVSTWIFMIGGVIVAIGVGAGLMALIFWGNRSGHDEDVHRSAFELGDHLLGPRPPENNSAAVDNKGHEGRDGG